jgi:hypothetical protein
VQLDAVQLDIVRTLTARYIWWKGPDVAPERALAQVMELGEWRDVRLIERTFGAEALRRVVRPAQPGWFSPRSWRFWHTRLGLIDPLATPPDLPRRHIP